MKKLDDKTTNKDGIEIGNRDDIGTKYLVAYLTDTNGEELNILNLETRPTEAEIRTLEYGIPTDYIVQDQVTETGAPRIVIEKRQAPSTDGKFVEVGRLEFGGDRDPSILVSLNEQNQATISINEDLSEIDFSTPTGAPVPERTESTQKQNRLWFGN